MSSIVMDAPTVQINSSGLKNLVSFIFTHERTLKEFGGIRIQLNTDCLLALKKRRKIPTYINTQEITRIAKDEFIYTVENSGNVTIYKRSSPITNEEIFWSSLSNSTNKCYHSGVSKLPDKSLFYEKWHRKYFSIHSVPRQSLLKIGGTKVTNQFISCLSRANGPGAIYSLSSARQGLFLLVYHQGSPRHWYIIPTYERQALRTLLHRESYSNCFEHKTLFIDPKVLDKHHIRYHRVVQYPNELIVLSAGTVTQSFTEDISWSESIEFALPSWIEDGHAYVPAPLCRCNLSQSSSLASINVAFFRDDLIRKYITSKLSQKMNDKSVILKDNDDLNMATVSAPIRSILNSSNVEGMASKNRKLIIPLERLALSFQSPPTALVAPSINSYESKEGENISDDNITQLLNEILESDSCYQIASTDSSVTSNKEQALVDFASELFSISSESTPLSDFNNYLDMEFPTSPLFLMSSGMQVKSPEIVAKETVTYSSVASSSPTMSKTIFVSHLPLTVDNKWLRSAFPHCRKIVFKKNYWNKNFRFALIEHRNYTDAQKNLSMFLAALPSIGVFSGIQARYAKENERQTKSKCVSSSMEGSYSAHDLHVGQIPGSVMCDQLQQLFPQATSINYRSGKTVRNRVKLGFAFLYFDDILAAAEVIANKDQYRIHNQPLSIVYKLLNK